MNLKFYIRCVGQVLLQIQLVPQSGYFFLMDTELQVTVSDFN